jgi:hypothetical protein
MTDKPTIANPLDDDVDILDISFEPFPFLPREDHSITQELYKRISRPRRGGGPRRARADLDDMVDHADHRRVERDHRVSVWRRSTRAGTKADVWQTTRDQIHPEWL